MAGYLEDYHLPAMRDGALGAARIVLGPVAAFLAGIQLGEFIAWGRAMDSFEMLTYFVGWPFFTWLWIDGALCGLLVLGLLVRYWLKERWRIEALLVVMVALAIQTACLSGRNPTGAWRRGTQVTMAVGTLYAAVRLIVWWWRDRHLRRAIRRQKDPRAAREARARLGRNARRTRA